MSNLGLERYLKGIGLELVRTPVGDRYVVEHMREHGFNVGGEQSGHIVLSDYGTTGDGLVAALQVLAVIQESGRRSARSAASSIRCPSCSRMSGSQAALHCEDDLVKDAIRDGEARLNGIGRLLIRKSGTEPVIRVMAEGDDENLVNAVVGDIVNSIQQAAAREQEAAE